MWISSDFEKKDNMYNAMENNFVTVIPNITFVKQESNGILEAVSVTYTEMTLSGCWFLA